jgi:hypothetical protein
MGQRALPPLLIVLGVSLGFLGGPGVGAARAAELTPQQKLEMKQLYERATRAYDVGKYNEAIEEYQKAYEIGGDPPMLYNIAQAYRLNDQPTEALRFYRRYLQRAPNARNREDVERKIAELEKSVEDRRKAAAAVTPPPAPATPPAPAPVVVAPTPAPPPAPVAAPADATGGTTNGSGTTTETPPPAPVEEQSQTRKVVSWSVVGAGVVTAGVGVVFGILAKQKSNSVTNMSNTANPPMFDPQLEHDGKVYNNLFIGLTIAGGAIAATGVVLLLTGGSSSDAAPAPAPATPAGGVTVAPWIGPGLAGAGANLRF